MLTLEKGKKGKTRFDKKKFDAAARFVYDNTGIAPDDIAKEQPLELVKETARVLSHAVETGIKNAKIAHEIPEKTREYINENIFIFSGLKTYHQLKEASMRLLDGDKNIKSFEKFREDIEAINAAYNRRYLEVEYGFAIHSAQMAARWNDFEHDGDEYNLQYRTANDYRVRHEHAELHGITLPVSDAFWNSYIPPLDWGCRCTVVQVLKDKYPAGNSAEAIAKGLAATTRIGKDGSNKLAMFRFNPGKDKIIFPQKHPYFPRNCATCDKNIRLARNIDANELCRVCVIARKIAEKSATAQEREKYLKEMETLLNKTVVKEVDGGKQISIKFTAKGNKHLYSDTFTRVKGLLNKKDLKRLNIALGQSTFEKSANVSEPRKDKITKFYYFKDKDKQLYYNVGEVEYKRKSGKIKYSRFLYSVTKTLKSDE